MSITYGRGTYSPTSPDPWENGQARMPKGWHVDGVDRGVLWAYREGHGSCRTACPDFVESRASGTFQERMDALVAAVQSKSR